MFLNNIIILCLASFSYTLGSALPEQWESRIVNGNPDNITQFPWHASVEVTYNNNPTINHCGGSIISNNFILTSADCIVNAKSIKIGMGSTLRLQPAKSLVSTSYFVHPQFSSTTFQNNIALIKLPSALVWTATLAPVRLVSRSQASSTFAGAETYFTGFGRTQANNITLSARLQWVRQRVITNQECSFHYQTQMVQAQQMCVIGWENPWQASCFGDGGGALVLNEWGTWTQVGVMSFIHLNGCQDARPTGFVRVSAHIDWIAKTAGYSFRP